MHGLRVGAYLCLCALHYQDCLWVRPYNKYNNDGYDKFECCYMTVMLTRNGIGTAMIIVVMIIVIVVIMIALILIVSVTNLLTNRLEMQEAIPICLKLGHELDQGTYA